jgi:GDP-4-dehydro-6-deoxy-D-mannose reductase
MAVLITGVTGFIGSHVADHLLARGERVVGLARSEQWCFGAEHLAGRVPVEVANLLEPGELTRVLERVRPTAVYHLAGQANVADARRDPTLTDRINVDGTRNLLDAIHQAAPDAALLHASSGQVYGQPEPAEMPIRETSPIRPLNEYARSKAAADEVVLDRVARGGLKAVIARFFNNIGPRQEASYVVPSFARQIAQFELAGDANGPVLMRVGRLDVRRDFNDVRDMVRALPLLLESAPPGAIVNVAAGRTVAVETILSTLLGMSSVEVTVETDPALVRPSDPSDIQVAIDRLRQLTGWSPEIPLETTLLDTLDTWRRRVRHEA